MATRFEKDIRRTTRNPGTRLYAPTRDSAAYDPEAEIDEATGEIPVQDDRTRPIPIRVQQREMTTLERIGIMFCSFLFAGMILFTLSGYERIARAYADINTLNSEIEDVSLHISELNVAIECAVTIDQAESAALAAGMTYPTQSQIYTAGDPIPALTAGLGDTPAGEDPTAPDEEGNGDGEPAPDEPVPADPGGDTPAGGDGE